MYARSVNAGCRYKIMLGKYGRVNSIGKPGPEKSESFTEYWAATLRQ